MNGRSQAIQSKAAHTGRRFVTVRFGNVLDLAGHSVVPIFRDQIRKGGPVTITDPRMVRIFMTIPEAAQLVIQAGALGSGGEIFVLDMGEPVKIVELAQEMVRLSGLRLRDDIDLAVVGMRPGKKLYEELYCTGEVHVPTRHPRFASPRESPSGIRPQSKPCSGWQMLPMALVGRRLKLETIAARLPDVYQRHGGQAFFHRGVSR